MSGAVTQISNIETEHLLSALTYTGKVVLRVIDETGNISLGHLEPSDARDVAQHLFEAAARSEYEQDLWSALKKRGLDDPELALIFQAVRAGEMRRHTDTL